ncbi:exodeoxyribonuclease V subunit gamma [Buchnera aphidicola (Diuraphis noxia)]|uniref:RecBCD enzyme subunit RecC n=1 Tax=Buchnera aphidicola subsp. Diuraphis noxia TaxID=118101 RepID=A0A1B2H966_BUCDN|nr:exodeoxyribonuclease V subunit gamma [Buchnera aphidicola]ANZ22646.1 exodeoxyribonuclease V subunit gamma [Buchnera aphidicola (Diuraphis noxia)]
MFIIFRSNKINILLSKVCQIIQKKPLSNIFEKEIFIHDSKILFKYLNIFISNNIGISANFKFYRPHDFIWKVFQSILYKNNLKNTCTQSIITWNIMNVLNKKNFCEHIKTKDNAYKKFKFSYLMATIFHQYLIYRPNWINEWEQNKNTCLINEDEIWQVKLWKEIINHSKKNNQSGYHFVNLFNYFQSLKNHNKIKKNVLPNRIFIISSFTLTPSYIKILKIISKYTNIYFLYITPFKTNIFYPNTIKNGNLSHKKKHPNNTILSLWRKYEEYYIIKLMHSKKIKITNFFKNEANKNINLLNNIKKNFLKFDCLNLKNIKKKSFLKIDNSISINICDNKYNEIQILHDTLLLHFNKNKNLKLDNIVVICDSIDDYMSSIHAIFEAKNENENLPFFISTKVSKKEEKIFLFFNKILNLSYSRFENEEILEFLNIPEIANHFNISEDDINILYHWIQEANIRWGINSKHKKSLSLPEHNANTWEWGIEKLLLSYATNTTENVWNDVVSCSVINTSRADLIGKLIIFINVLKKWKKKISKSQYLSCWRSLFREFINDFFYKKTNKPVQNLHKSWIKMIDDISYSNYTQKISIKILKKHFNCTIKRTYQKFLPGVINFCHPSDICYIPFEIICIIGSDYKSTLKNNKPNSFINILNKYPLIGDLNFYEQYCYLFLQNISCAQKYLYISYVGTSIKDESKTSSSILIEQLLDYIAFNFFPKHDYNLNIKDNKKRIINLLCKNYKKEYFYKKENIKNTLDNSIKNKIKTNNNKTYNIKLFKNNISNKIHLKDLIFFWKNPIRYFFNHSLKIKFRFQKEKINNTEPFCVSQIESFKIKEMLLTNIINQKDTEKILKIYILSGKLPYGFFGENIFKKIKKDMESIAKSVIKHKSVTKEKKINFILKKFQIHGILYNVQSTGLIRWQPNTISYSDRIALWIEHLMYSCIKGFGESKIIGPKNQIWSYSSLNHEKAYNYLYKYIIGYIKGSKELILLTKSGASWLDAVYNIKKNIIQHDDNTKLIGYKKLFKTWIGNNYIKGEKEDLYIKKTITQLDLSNVEKICKTAKKWIMPLLRNKKIYEK